jgi:hypothetical protein
MQNFPFPLHGHVHSLAEKGLQSTIPPQRQANGPEQCHRVLRVGKTVTQRKRRGDEFFLRHSDKPAGGLWTEDIQKNSDAPLDLTDLTVRETCREKTRTLHILRRMIPVKEKDRIRIQITGGSIGFVKGIETRAISQRKQHE